MTSQAGHPSKRLQLDPGGCHENGWLKHKGIDYHQTQRHTVLPAEAVSGFDKS